MENDDERRRESLDETQEYGHENRFSTADGTTGPFAPLDTNYEEADGLELFDYGSEVGELDQFLRISFQDDVFGKPVPNLAHAIEVLRNVRILIIGGVAPDKRLLARRTAWELAELLTEEDGLGIQHTIPAIEVPGLVADVDVLDAHAAPSVFVFSQVDTSRVYLDLELLRRKIRNRHWVVIATDRAQDAWQLKPPLDQSWLEVDETTLYEPGDLRRYFEQELSSGARSRLEALGRAGEMPRPADLVSQIATRLGYVEAIEAFIDLLEQEPADGPRDLDELITAAQGRREAVQTWFHHQLKPREQVIALALALFDGMDEYFAFESIEKLMAGPWRERDTALRFIDYGDLLNIRQHIARTGDDSRTGTVYCRGDTTRQAILEAGWRTHRRQIIAAIPHLRELAVTLDRQELTLHTRDFLRQVRTGIGETMGALAILSMDAVQPHLLKLIASKQVHAHRVVAVALRALRRAGRTAQVMETLEHWRTHGRFWALIERLAGGGAGAHVDRLIGTAMVTILAELAAEDRMDAIDPQIVDLLLRYAASDDNTILSRLSQIAVPSLVRHHAAQMIGLVDEIGGNIGAQPSRNAAFASGFAQGLGRAGRVFGSLVRPTVEGWIAEGLAQSDDDFDAEVITQRARKLTIASLTLGHARSERTDGAVDGAGTLDDSTSGHCPAEAAALLNKVLAKEQHPFVRRAAFDALGMLMQREFEAMSKALPDTIAAIDRGERPQLLDRLVDLHCHQLSRQPGGDALLVVKGPLRNYRCPVWYDRDPETTLVEDTVFDSFVGREDLASLRTDFIREIRGVIERSREAKQTQLQEDQARAEEERRKYTPKDAPAIDRHQVAIGGFTRWFVVPLVTLTARSLRHDVIGTLASISNDTAADRREFLDRMRRAQERATNAKEGKRLRAIADATERALWWRRNGIAILCIAIAGVVALSVAAFR